MSFNDYTERQRSLSSTAVAKGGRPLRRIAAPALPPMKLEGVKTKLGAAVVSEWGFSDWSRFLLMHPGPKGVSATLYDRGAGTLTGFADGIGAVLEEWGDRTALVFPDAQLAQRAVAMLERSDDEPHRSAALRVGVLLSLPVTHRLLVLSRLAAETWWLPAGRQRNDYATWRSVLDIDEAGASGMKRVVDLVLTGTVSSVQNQFCTKLFEATEAIHSAIGRYRSAASAIRQFTGSNVVTTAYDAYRATDPVGIHQHQETGEAPRVAMVRPMSGMVEVKVETACRLKPACEVRVFDASDGSDQGIAYLASISFDEEQGMTALLRTMPGRTTSPGAVGSKGLRWLLANRGAPAYLVAMPYLGMLHSRSSHWVGTKATVPGVTRDVPLDVSLAGAGS